MCIGGCYKPNDASTCFSCKYFELNGVCISKCPKNYYEFLGRRCVTKDECINRMPVKKQLPDKKDKELGDGEYKIWKAFQNICHYDCPEGYREGMFGVNEFRF